MLRIATLSAVALGFACVLVDGLPAQGTVRRQLGQPGSLRLPDSDDPRQDPERAAPRGDTRRVDGRDDAFERALFELRRSLFLGESKEQQLLLQLGERYDRIPERALSLARHADSDTLYACMRALHLYGVDSPRENGERIKFLLLTRPFRKATEVAMDTMVHLMGDGAKEPLFALLTADRALVRSNATERLADVLAIEGSEADARRLLVLAQQADRDVQLASIRLLGVLPVTNAQIDALLVRTLSRQPDLAMAAVEAMRARGVAAAELLVPILESPAIDRGYSYAALALAAIEEDQRALAGLNAHDIPGGALFTDAMVPHLRSELSAPDTFVQSAVALGLADLAWRSDDTGGESFGDREIVRALVQVVAPREFVVHLSDLQPIAQQRLARFAGRDFGMAYRRWVTWSESIADIDGWVGARADVAIEEASAPLAVVVVPVGMQPLGSDQESTVPVWRFRGDRVDWLETTDDTYDVVLDATQMMLLIQQLRGVGFPRRVAVLGENDPEAGLRRPPVELMVGGARCSTPARIDPRSLNRFVSAASKVGEAEAWQLYRDPETAPDLLAWWRSERRWRADHTGDADALANRDLDRILDALAAGAVSGPKLTRALTRLSEITEQEGILTAPRGLRLVEAVSRFEEWGETVEVLVAIALRADGDAVWTELLDVAEQRAVAGHGTGAILEIFRLLGNDRLLRAFDHRSQTVRMLAMQEAAEAGEDRAIPRLVEVLESDDPTMQRVAVDCLGRLRAIEAEPQLVELADRNGVAPEVRRATWIALGRIGGPSAMGVIGRAQFSTDDEDRRAVIVAAGSLRRPEAMEFLANIYGIRGEDELGLLAKAYLREAGDQLAAPALRRLMASHGDDSMRRNVALLLGEFQDPNVLEALVRMLDGPASFRAAQLIATITGVDTLNANDRAGILRQWQVRNVRKTQGEWLIAALEANEIETTLTDDQLGLGTRAETVRELCRLMVEVKLPHLRCLAGKVLRDTTESDYGVVSMSTDEVTRRGIADRYLFLLEAPESAANTGESGRRRQPR